MEEFKNGFYVENDVVKTYEGEYDELLDDFKIDVVIPKDWSSINTNEYKYYKLGFALFKNYKKIKSIFIPNIVSEIGDECFFNCFDLTNISIDNSVIAIGEKAFANCIKLESIELPTKIKILSPGLFSGCKMLSTIKMNEGLERIGTLAFSGCSSLNEIELPQSVEIIEDSAFEMCSKLETIVIGENIKTIHKNAFSGCSNLKSIIIKNKSIDLSTEPNNSCLWDIKSKTLFHGNVDLSIPNCIRKIGYRAFFGVKTDSELNLSNEVSIVEEEAFSLCNFDKLKISSSVKDIEENAFALSKCNYIYSDNERYIAFENTFLIDNRCQKLIFVSEKQEYIIPNFIKIIGPSNFSKMEIKSVIIPEGVEAILDNCFNDVTVQETIILPKSIKFIAPNVFIGFKGNIQFNGDAAELDNICFDSGLKNIIKTNDSFSF